MTEEKPQKPARDPQALSGEYHKARKQLMLWAAILFIWELVGIDLEKAKESGGNTGAIISAIKSPQAVPWVLLILVGYFAFKLRIEWKQCNKIRRQVPEAKQDYYSAWVFAVASYFLYFGQAISRVQFADVLNRSDKTDSLVRGASLSMLTFLGIALLLESRKWKSKRRILGVLVSLTLCLVGLANTTMFFLTPIHWRFALGGFVFGLMVFGLAIFLWRRLGLSALREKPSGQSSI